MKFFKGHKPWNKGLKKRLNTGKTHFKKGNKPVFSKEHRRKLSEAQKGKKASPETIEKLRKSHLVHIPWNKGLRKNKEKLTMCNKQQGDISHAVHHIDYDKKNCDPTNLITLCFSCHGKTNYNRKKWIKYFKKTL